MPRILTALLCASALAVSCSDDRVALTYGTDPGRRLLYRLTLEAKIERVLSGRPRRQTVRASFDAQQSIIERLPRGRTSASMVLRPRRLVVDGRSQQAGSIQRFDVVLGKDGRIVRIAPAEDRSGVPAEETSSGDPSLAPLGLERLLPRLRPVLPARAVRPGDRWSSTSRFQDAAGRFSLSLSSRLDSLGRAGDHDAALVRTTYESPVRRREVFANAVTDIEGEDVGAQAAWFALDGFLVEAVSDSVGTYRVVFRPPGGQTGVAPVEGSLLVELHTELRLIELEGGA